MVLILSSPYNLLSCIRMKSIKYSIQLLVLICCLFNLSINSTFAEEKVQDHYILGPGDKIEISVYGEDDLSMTALLGNNGIVSYPFLGELKISGLSVKALEKLIADGLKGDYLIHPNVYVHVLEYRPFYIHGEVKQPGSYPYQPGLTINQAIAIAGGLTERASTDKIFLFKEQDKEKQLKVNLNAQVNAGDTITIEQRFF